MGRGWDPDAARSSFAEAGRRFVHVLAEKELGVTGSGRIVTRDPNEVLEVPCNPLPSSEAFRLH